MRHILLNAKKSRQGIGIVEIMTAVALAAIFFTAIYSLVIFSLRATGKNVRGLEALYLAEEGVEAVRFAKNESWDANIAPLANATTYYPVISGGEWTLSAVNPGLVNGVYTRTVTLQEVHRDVNDDISAAGVVDSGTRKITVKVTWTETGGAPAEKIIETYVTDFLNN